MDMAEVANLHGENGTTMASCADVVTILGWFPALSPEQWKIGAHFITNRAKSRELMQIWIHGARSSNFATLAGSARCLLPATKANLAKQDRRTGAQR